MVRFFVTISSNQTSSPYDKKRLLCHRASERASERGWCADGAYPSQNLITSKGDGGGRPKRRRDMPACLPCLPVLLAVCLARLWSFYLCLRPPSPFEYGMCVRASPLGKTANLWLLLYHPPRKRTWPWMSLRDGYCQGRPSSRVDLPAPNAGPNRECGESENAM